MYFPLAGMAPSEDFKLLFLYYSTIVSSPHLPIPNITTVNYLRMKANFSISFSVTTMKCNVLGHLHYQYTVETPFRKSYFILFSGFLQHLRLYLNFNTFPKFLFLLKYPKCFVNITQLLGLRLHVSET